MPLDSIPQSTDAVIAFLQTDVFPFIEDEAVSSIQIPSAPLPSDAAVAFLLTESPATFTRDLSEALAHASTTSTSFVGRQLVIVAAQLNTNTLLHSFCTVAYSDKTFIQHLSALHLAYYSNASDATQSEQLAALQPLIGSVESVKAVVASRSLPNPPKGSRRSIRVAILGAAGIAKKVFGAIEKAGHEVVAIGCRDIKRGQQFADECVANIAGGAKSKPHVCSYQEAITFPGVQVVYIPLPVTFREEWIEKSIALGKHVVCEKPPAINVDKMRSWVERLHKQEKVFLDGTMLSHGERVKRVWEHLHVLKSIGEVRHIHTDFSFVANPDDIRQDPSLEPIGALGDIGWYCVRYAQHLFGKPEAVLSANATRNAKGGLTEVFATLQYAGGVIQTLRVSFHTTVSMELHVSGSQGNLHLDDFCLPCLDGGKGIQFSIKKNYLVQEGCDLNHHRVGETVHVEGEDATFQETQMWRNIGHLVNQKFSLPLASYWSGLAMDTQETLDKILAKC